MGPVMLGLILLLFPATFLPDTPKVRTFWVAIVFVCLVAGLFCRLVMDLWFGWVSSRTGRWYSRAHEPTGYWVQTAINVILTLAGFGCLVAMRWGMAIGGSA